MGAGSPVPGLPVECDVISSGHTPKVHEIITGQMPHRDVLPPLAHALLDQLAISSPEGNTRGIDHRDVAFGVDRDIPFIHFNNGNSSGIDLEPEAIRLDRSVRAISRADFTDGRGGLRVGNIEDVDLA